MVVGLIATMITTNIMKMAILYVGILLMQDIANIVVAFTNVIVVVVQVQPVVIARYLL
jgi:hypothetical protein